MDVGSVLAGMDRDENGRLVVRLQGALDMSTQLQLTQALSQALTVGAPAVVLDFSAVTGVSGAALLPLAVAQVRSRSRGYAMEAVGVPAAVEAVFGTVWPGDELPLVASAGPRPDSRTALQGWAAALPRVDLTGLPPDVPRINVQGQTACGPTRGFGAMWHKVYRGPLAGASAGPAEVVAAWREHFGDFWPTGNRIFLSYEGIVPGGPGVITLTVPPGLQLITGIQVAYSGPDCFVFLPLRGHMFCGLIVFGAVAAEDEVEAQVQVLVRPSDPMWEAAMSMGGYAQEDKSWFHTLTELARRLGATTQPRLESSVVDESRRWGEVGNVLANSAVWSGLYQAVGLLRTGPRAS